MGKMLFLNLRLHDGTGAPAAAPAQPGAMGTPTDGKAAGRNKQAEQQQTEPTALTADQEFEQLISKDGRFRESYTQRVEKTVKDRLRKYGELQEQFDAFSPSLEIIANKYGVDPKDPVALQKAIDGDDSFFEAEALKRGLSVQQYKHQLKIEAENEKFREAEAERRRVEQSNQIMARWMQESEALKQQFPSFDFNKEVNDPVYGPRFMAQLRAGVPVDHAYKSVHMDDILQGTMQYAAQKATEKTVASIQARGILPDENGTHAAIPANVQSTDMRDWDIKRFEKIHAAVQRGERITDPRIFPG